VSDAPRSEAASFDSPEDDVPTVDELDRVAYDAVIRSAPRFGRFIGTGVAIGAVVGLVIGLALPNSTGVGRSVVAMLVAAGFAIIGAVVSGAIVVGLDGTRRAPQSTGFPWEAADFEPPATDAPAEPGIEKDEAK
jgi:hypothetical protein